ncbi:MAG: hypothetical protein H6701_04005 [Myxococcales bacterium]|nr:hypothetical protein [Myxococcales bacterium]
MISRRELLATLVGLGLLTAADAHAAKGDKKKGDTRKTAAGGDYWRLDTAGGVVYVWVPPNYHRPTAGSVIYVHGYWTSADRAWREHQLPQQFRKSRQNAIFIVPSAPTGPEDGVKFKTLGGLRGAIRKKGIRLPDGPIVVIGHSGAYRTIAEWVDHALVQQVTLLDGFYGREDKWEEFIVTGKKAKQHKLVLVGVTTTKAGVAFARRHKGVRRNGLPTRYEDFTRAEKRARLLHINARAGHSELVAGGSILPLMLRLTPLPLLKG